MSLALFTGGAPGLWELLIVFFVILLLFGARKLPDLARSLGKSLGEFKKGKEEGERTGLPPESGSAPDDANRS
ncbi:MAG: twin-arginine translocase TatA/TatE family subunit [Lentisphaerae bacterium]|nr:twin-arginine translocase TatA/TatE family subunit [Lentisphaerota bacterium]